MLHLLLVQTEENADIGGSIEDEDEGSDDPILEVRMDKSVKVWCSDFVATLLVTN